MVMNVLPLSRFLAMCFVYIVGLCRSSDIRRCSISNWISGPFATNADQDNGCLSGTLHDSLEVTPYAKTIEQDGIKLLSTVRTRSRISVAFTVSGSTKESVELRWAQFRGNLQLVRLGKDNQRLVIHSGETSLQFSAGGHLFVAMAYDEIDDEQKCSGGEKDTFQELEDSIDCITGMYLLPVGADTVEINIALEGDRFYNLDRLIEIAGTSCHNFHSGVLETESRDPADSELLSECFRSMLLAYWEHQRLSQVPLYIWAVPTIPVPSRHTDSTSDAHGASTRQLWKLTELSSSLSSDASAWHLMHRESIRTMEPPISLVFNQLQARTFYVPLPAHLLERMVEEVQRLVSDWLGVGAHTLEVTGAYASREYQRDAVVRWHVDPVESQPLTAIVHIAAAAPSHDATCGNDGVCEEAGGSDSWTLQLPKSLASFASYNLSGARADYIQNNAYDPAHLENIELKTGQVLLLQSAKLPHARLVPLRGAWYANAFVHFASHGWAEQEVVQLLH